MLDELLVKYAEEEVYLKVVAESGDGFDKATDPVVLINRENELRELIRVVVDKEGLDGQFSWNCTFPVRSRLPGAGDRDNRSTGRLSPFEC